MSRPARTLLLVMGVLLALARSAAADEIHVMLSGAFTAAYNQLVPEFERTTGHTVVTTAGPSMGSSPNTIPNRLQRGERADVVILAAASLDDLIRQGRVVAASRVDLARSRIGMVVAAGAPKPDISSIEALKQTLLHARAIAVSSSASGIYLSTELFPRLGVADAVKPKSIVADGPAAAVVARGDAEIAFQQISELLPVPGVDYVGPLPSEAQRVTVFSTGLVGDVRAREAALALIGYLSSPAARHVMERTGLEPIDPSAGSRSR